MRRFVTWSLALTLSVAACTEAGSPSPSPEASSEAEAAASALPAAAYATLPVDVEPLRLVTLGDAYTAGTDTAAPMRDSWPAQLVQAMGRGEIRLRLVGNLAESGKTSENVMSEQLSQVGPLRPDVVTLQVGVNDIIAGEFEAYRSNLTVILDELLAIVPANRIFVITTPDHTLTARGGDWGPRAAGSAAVAEANEILMAVARARGITVVDIGPVNGLAAADPTLVIDDGPYPTAKQYAGWVEVIGPQMTRALLAAEP